MKNKLNELRTIMKRENVQAYIVCTNDFHGSEYIGDYFKTREYLSGFTGSAGTLVVLDHIAALWTDGRYFIQAEAELKGSEIVLMKDGEKDVKTLFQFLYDELNEGDSIGFDGRTVSIAFVERLLDKFKGKKINLKYDKDLIDEVWSDRPDISAEKIYMIDEKYTGESTKSKLSRLKDKLKTNNIETIVITTLDEITWLLNLRGNDIKYCPLFLSYMIISSDKSILYTNVSALNSSIRDYLNFNDVLVKDYNEFYADVTLLDSKKLISVDKSNTNYMISRLLEEKTVIYECSPVELMKSIKNQTEINNEKMAHIKDGVAVTKFIYYIKKNAGKITELEAAKELEKFRNEGIGNGETGYIEPSFEPIIAYKEHGAIVHYSANEQTNTTIGNAGLLLMDTGGHYLEGTTDITRTIAMGETTEEEKKLFTLVLKGNLQLGDAKFLYGVTGKNLDILAREPLWKEFHNYNHGTGHGVGYLLNVHEGPNCFRWQKSAMATEDTVFEEGMITSNEPGVYLEGKFGIRHENLILCKKLAENSYGTFMGFETLTMVPFDVDAIDISYLNDYEIKLLNDYHKNVYDSISKYFEGDELEWLKNVTKPI